MNQEVSLNTFQNDMKSNFSYKGSEVLYNYLNDIEDDCGMVVNYDPVAFRCEYNEYESFKEFKEEYSSFCKSHNIKKIDDISDHTQLIKIDNDSFIIQAF